MDMFIEVDVKPIVQYTGSSARFADRSYYYLPVPSVQFVTRGFEWDGILAGQVFDANVSDTQSDVVVDPHQPTVSVTKITLRRQANQGEALRPVPLSRLLAQILAQDISGVLVFLSQVEREKLSQISELPHEAIKSLISYA